MKYILKATVATVALCLVVVLATSPNIFAVEGKNTGESTTTTNTTTTTPTTEAPKTTLKKSTDSKTTVEPKKIGESTTTGEKATEVETESEKAKDPDTTAPNAESHQKIDRKKLDDTKKSVCEARKDTINTRIGNVTERSQNQYTRIDQIFTATTKFYTEKSLSVSNYDELVANVTQAKIAATATLQAIKDAPKFSCASDGPKADVQSFLNLRLDKQAAFKTYRDAVKALVDAVKTAAKTTGGAQ